MHYSSPRPIFVPFIFILLLRLLFGGAVGMEGKKANMLLSQKPDPNEKQVINLDQDVQVCGYMYFWWRMEELLCMNHLVSFSFYLDRGYLFLFSLFLTCLVGMWHTFFGYASFIFEHAKACGIPSLGMHLLFLFA